MEQLISSNQWLDDLFSQPVITDSMIESYADQVEFPNTAAGIVKLNILKKIVDRIDKNLKNHVACHGLDIYDSFHGVRIDKANTPMSFQLDQDAEYLTLKEKLEARAKLLKQQAKLFQDEQFKGKNSDDFTGLVIDGEQIPVVEFSPGKETIKLTFPKK